MPRRRIDLARRSQAGASHDAPAGDGPLHGPLQEMAGFVGNPGHLRMLAFVPEGLPAGAPLVVALHGCTQTAGGYDRGTGWSRLATRQGFALLLPEQRRVNNANRCFNWFDPAHSQRDRGEALSIRQAVGHMLAGHRLDPQRVFITGLSAGGAMTAVMLATYPEVFAAGAILAGLPYGAAHSVQEAFEAMATGRPRPARAWGELVRHASPHRGPWPRVAVWQGDADITVRPVNAEEIVKQWRDLHGLSGAPLAGESRSPAHRVRVWLGADGRPVLEHHAIAGLAHGVPIGPGLGEPGPHILNVGLSSTEAIADFFGLGAAPARAERVIRIGRDGVAHTDGASRPAEEQPDDSGFHPGRVIRRALRAAGLLDR